VGLKEGAVRLNVRFFSAEVLTLNIPSRRGNDRGVLMDQRQCKMKNDEAIKTEEMGATGPYRILLADDHAVVRHGLRASLHSLPGIEICGEAATGREAIELAQALRPDLVILDLSMPEMNGVDAARAIRRALPGTEVMVLTLHISEEIALVALRLGVRGYVTKSDPHSELLAAVQSVREHRSYVTSQLAAKLQDEIERIEAQRSADHFSPTDGQFTQQQTVAALLRSEEEMRKKVAAILDGPRRSPAP
jgi:two-component system response regulator NreC